MRNFEMKLIRRLLAVGATIPDMSAEMVSPYLHRIAKPDQYAVFELPAKNTFAQVMRMKSGGLHVEVSRRTPELEALLGTLGEVMLVDGFGFPTVDGPPGNDARVAPVVAQALALLAADAGVANRVHVLTGLG